MAILKLLDFVILAASAVIAQILLRSFASTATLLGLRVYIPTSPDNSKDPARKRGKPIKLQQQDAYGPSLPGADTLLSVPLSRSTILLAQYFPILELLVYAAVLVSLVSVAYPAAHAVLINNRTALSSLPPLLQSLTLATPSVSTPLVTTIFVAGIAAVSLAGVDLFSRFTSPDDKAYSFVCAFIGMLLSATLFAFQPKDHSFFSWNPDVAAHAVQQYLKNIAEQTMMDIAPSSSASDVANVFSPSSTVVCVMLCMLGAIFSALLFAPSLRFVRSMIMETSPPAWASAYIRPSGLSIFLFRVHTVLPLLAAISWVKPLFDDPLSLDPRTADILRGALALAVAAVVLLNSRRVAQRYLDSSLIAWYTIKHSPKKNAQERANASIVVQAKSEAVRRLIIKVAVQSVAPGVVYLCCGLALLLIEYFKEGNNSGDDVLKSIVYVLAGYIVTWLGVVWLVYCGGFMWLFRTGTLLN